MQIDISTCSNKGPIEHFSLPDSHCKFGALLFQSLDSRLGIESHRLLPQDVDKRYLMKIYICLFKVLHQESVKSGEQFVVCFGRRVSTWVEEVILLDYNPTQIRIKILTPRFHNFNSYCSLNYQERFSFILIKRFQEIRCLLQRLIGVIQISKVITCGQAQGG